MRYHLHFNPILVFKVLFDSKYKNIILGVSYNDINIVLLALLKKIHLLDKKCFFWAEANYLTLGARKDSLLKKILRRFVFSCVDGALIVPGKMSEITFEKWGIKSNKFIRLPNTISDGELSLKPELKNKKNLPVFFMPIRLIESIKGAINFFEAIGSQNIIKCLFFIAGDGKDKDLYRKYIEEHNYTDNIKLLGFCNAKKMEELYNTANVFVLPSFSDPSPLSMVEALKTRLPILCSTHCGNHFEVVKDCINGCCFNPLDHADIRLKFEWMMNNVNSWEKMGNYSYEIYQEIYRTENVAENFIKEFNLIASN